MNGMRAAYGVPVARGIRLQIANDQKNGREPRWMIVTSADSQYVYGYIEGGNKNLRLSFHPLSLAWPWDAPKRIRPKHHGTMVQSSLYWDAEYRRMIDQKKHH